MASSFALHKDLVTALTVPVGDIDELSYSNAIPPSDKRFVEGRELYASIIGVKLEVRDSQVVGPPTENERHHSAQRL